MRLLSMVTLLIGSMVAMGGQRIALVIGNETYAERPLQNPVNDAEAVSAKLKTLGFEVTTLKNATLTEMRIATKRFGRLARQGGNTDAVVFFAGHGIQFDGVNYLMDAAGSYLLTEIYYLSQVRGVRCNMRARFDILAQEWGSRETP